MSVASEYEHAERVVTDVALLHDMAAGKLDTERVKEAAGILLEHKRSEMPGVSVAVAARLLPSGSSQMLLCCMTWQRGSWTPSG